MKVYKVRAGRMVHYCDTTNGNRVPLCGSHKMYGGHQGFYSEEMAAKRHTCMTCVKKAKALGAEVEQL